MNLKQEIEKLIGETDGNEVERAFFGCDVGEIAEDYGYDDELTKFKQALQAAGISYEEEAQHGGEGEGEDFWTVYSFTKAGEKVFVQFDGWYQSYNGSEYTEWFFVEPKEVVVTQYFKSK